MLIFLLAILVLPLLSTAESITINPPPCPEGAQDGDEFNDEHYVYVCKDGQPDFVGCRDENGTVIKMNEEGVYFSDDVADLVLNCTTVISDNGNTISVNATFKHVMKVDGCLYNYTLLKVNEIAEDGEERYLCKQVSNGVFTLQNYNINDCLYKGKYYKSNKEHTTGNKKNLRYVYFCNVIEANNDAKSEQKDSASRFILKHCITPKGTKMEVNDSTNEEGKDYTCTNGSKKKKE